MIACLHDHMNYVHGKDPDVRRFFRHSARGWATNYLQMLRRVETRRLRLPAALPQISDVHAVAIRQSAVLMSAIPERDCCQMPPPSLWIRLGSDAEALSDLHRGAVTALRSTLQSATIPGMRFYGGIKSPAAIKAKVRHHCITGDELDLLDCVRFRVVLPDLSHAFFISKAIWEAFGDHVLRCRNYYVRPRHGWSDPYRAVHFALEIGGTRPTGIAELQVLTLAKDAVGLADHAILHHRAIPYLGQKHRAWLQGFAYAANILDQEQAHRRRTRC